MSRKSAKSNVSNITDAPKRGPGRPRKNPPVNPVAQAAAQMPSMDKPAVVGVSSDILLPSPEDSVKVLAELAQLNDKALAAGKRYEDLKEQTKSAKEHFDQLSAQVLSRLRVCTHKSDLPLFSEQQEQDLARMVAAGQGQNGGVTVLGAPQEGVPEPDKPVLPAGPETPPEGLDDSGVF